jgi:hypothetical protein
MEFKTYNIDGDNIYIASPLGLAELNREHVLFGQETSQLCEDLLKAKIDYEIEIENMRKMQNVSPERFAIQGRTEKIDIFHELFTKMHRDAMNMLANLNNSNAPDFYKNKNIFIVLGPDAFTLIKVRD